MQRPYQVLSEPEAAALIGSAEQLRDRTLLAVMLGGGLRVSETAALKVDEVLEDADGEMLIHVLEGKGQKSRTVPVRSDVASLVRAYLQPTGRRLGDGGPLFLPTDRAAHSRTGKPLSPRSIAYLVATAAEAAGVVAKRISPHSLRHTYALRALRYTGNVMAVAKL